jgi:hypothetical protein
VPFLFALVIRLLLADFRFLLTAYCLLLLVVCHLLSAIRLLLADSRFLPTAYYLLLLAICHKLSAIRYNQLGFTFSTKFFQKN